MAAAPRKQYFVQKAMQLRFARFVILFVFVSSIQTGGVIFLVTFLLMGEKLASVYPQGRQVPIFQSVYVTSFLGLLGVLPLIFYGSIVFSHRIAGPLPKIYRLLKEIGQGNFDQKLILRKNDELKELADAINDMTDNLKTKRMNGQGGAPQWGYQDYAKLLKKIFFTSLLTNQYFRCTVSHVSPISGGKW